MLFVSQAAAAVTAALDDAAARGRVAVIGQPRLARAVAGEGRDVLQLSPRLRALRRSRGPSICGSAGALPLADGSLAAVVGVGAGDGEGWESLLEEWSRVVEGGGRVVLVDRAAPSEASRRALCAGLTDLAQRSAGRTVVTSGTVRKL